MYGVKLHGVLFYDVSTVAWLNTDRYLIISLNNGHSTSIS